MKRNCFISILAFYKHRYYNCSNSSERGSGGANQCGATVLVKGTAQGTVTDVDGVYTVAVPEDGLILLSLM